jgi:protein TonB
MAVPSPTQIGAEPRGKDRSVAPWFILVLLAGIAASLATIVIMRDKGETPKPTENVAAADTTTQAPDAKIVDDDDRVLAPVDEAPPDAAMKTAQPPRVDASPPKPEIKPTKRPTTHRNTPKRTGNVDKPVETVPEPKHTEPPKTVDPPKPAIVDPPKPVEPPKAVPIDPPKPTEPAKPARTPVVAASAVTKVSGELPPMRVAAADDASVTAKLCIDETGRVSSVKLVKAPADLTSDLSRALSSWKYKPYTNRDSKLSPACFVVSLRLVVK